MPKAVGTDGVLSPAAADNREVERLSRLHPAASTEKSTAQQKKLAEDHLHLVRELGEPILSRWRIKGPDADDLLACGMEGLVQAAARFDCTRDTEFEFFARRRIKGAIQDGLRKVFSWSARRVNKEVDDVSREGVASGVGGHGGGRVILAGPNGAAVYQPTWTDPRIELLRERIDRLPEKQRRVIELHDLEERTLTEAAREMRISQSRASRLHTEAFEALRETMGQETVLRLLPSTGPRKQSAVRDRQERGGRGMRRRQSRFGPPIAKAAGIP